MPRESDIRDKLSDSLDILEPGLTLIEKNHKLMNFVGAKGFIDILAKDRFGNLVIIELKRSDPSAREALFEILKYMPLFRRQHGVPEHRIRCFIVSTSWHELLVPFSEFRRVSKTQTEGFRIDVDDVGNVLSATTVIDHVERSSPLPFRVHAAYLYRTAPDKQAAIRLLREALISAGTQGYLLFHIDYCGDSKRIIYPFAAYVVPTRIEPELQAALIGDAVASLEENDGSAPEPMAVRVDVEDTFLAGVNQLLREHFRSTDLEFSPGSPEKFTGMLEGGWTVTSIERVGPYSSPAVMSDADLIEMVKGVAGDSEVRFRRMTSPRHHLDWAEIKAAAVYCLRGNPTWLAGFAWFLEKVEREFADGTLLTRIYNPLLLPESLYNSAVMRNADYLPELALTALSADGSRIESLLGSIVWDGRSVPVSVEEVFTEDLCDNLVGYYFVYTLGTAWELDDELMRRHGLQYSLWWITAAGEDKQARWMVVLPEGVIEAGSEGPTAESLSHYFIASRRYLEELCTQIDACVGR